MAYGCGSSAITKPKTCVVITHPLVEPVSLAAAKAQCRILPENAEDDEHLVGLIMAARRMAEARLGVTWGLTQYRAKVCGCIGCGCSCGCDDRGIMLPKPPVFIDADHPVIVETPDGIVPADQYRVESDAWPALLVPLKGWRGPATITFWAGVGPGEPSDPLLVQSSLMLVAHWYMNREAVSPDGVGAEVPLAYRTMLAACSWSGRY